jgi:hypothetical protein
MRSGRQTLLSLTDISALSGLCQIAPHRYPLVAGLNSSCDAAPCSLFYLITSLPVHPVTTNHRLTLVTTTTILLRSPQSQKHENDSTQPCHLYPAFLQDLFGRYRPGSRGRKLPLPQEPHPAPPGSSHILFTRFQLSYLVISII